MKTVPSKNSFDNFIIIVRLFGYNIVVKKNVKHHQLHIVCTHVKQLNQLKYFNQNVKTSFSSNYVDE